MQTDATGYVDIVAEAIGSPAGSRDAHALLQFARELRSSAARSGVPVRVSGDVGSGDVPTGGGGIVVALRCGAYPAAPPRPCVQHPFLPRQESLELASLVSRHLAAATGWSWPTVLLWGALAVARSGGTSTPAPGVAVYLGRDVLELGFAAAALRQGLVTAFREALGLESPANEAQLTAAEPIVGTRPGPAAPAEESAPPPAAPEEPAPPTPPAAAAEPPTAPAGEPAPPTPPAAAVEEPAAELWSAAPEPLSPTPVTAPGSAGGSGRIAERRADAGLQPSAPAAPEQAQPVAAGNRGPSLEAAKTEGHQAHGADRSEEFTGTVVAARDPTRGHARTLESAPSTGPAKPAAREGKARRDTVGDDPAAQTGSGDGAG